VLQARGPGPEAALDALAGLVRRRQRVLEDGSDEVGHRHPQVLGEALQLLFEQRRDAGVDDALFPGTALRWVCRGHGSLCDTK